MGGANWWSGKSPGMEGVENQDGEGFPKKKIKNQDVDDDDLHFMQKALLRRQWEASTPTLHRHHRHHHH